MVCRSRSSTSVPRRDADQGRVTDFVSEVYRHKTRERIWVSETAWLRAARMASPRIFEGTVLDASARMQSEAKIAHMAHHDTLTGLPNRAYLTERIENAREIAQRPLRGHYLDLDRFKEVNDTLGTSPGTAAAYRGAPAQTMRPPPGSRGPARR